MYYNIHCLPLTIKQHIKIINLLYLLCCGQQWCDCIRVAVIWNHSNYVTVTVLIYALQSSHDLGHMNYNSEFKNLAMVNLWNLVSAAAILSNLLKTPSKSVIWVEQLKHCRFRPCSSAYKIQSSKVEKQNVREIFPVLEPIHFTTLCDPRMMLSP